MADLKFLGMRRHETCRFGTLSEAWIVEEDGTETPTLQPLCHWELPARSPPAVRRVWSGAVDYDKDCAACLAHDPSLRSLT